MSVLTYPGLGTGQEQSRIHIKWHKTLFGTGLFTWGSTAGPCPANLCKELTWGTLMGTAVIVPKVCWKKNSWTQLKTLAQLPQIESARPSGSPFSSLSLPNLWWKGIIHQSIWSSLFCLKSQRLFLLFNILYKALLTKAYYLLRAFGNSECKGYISLLWSFFGTQRNYKCAATAEGCLGTSLFSKEIWRKVKHATVKLQNVH